MKVGVLSLQGAFNLHIEALARLGVKPIEIRTAEALGDVEALIIPGGESSTISMLLDSSGIFDPLRERVSDGMPVMGTCAGMILLASKITDGRDDQRPLAAIDIDVRRNGYGRQINSFESALLVEGINGTFNGVFIRAPLVQRIGKDVEVLAVVDGSPVMCRCGSTLVTSFHPELSGDDRIHLEFLEIASKT